MTLKYYFDLLSQPSRAVYILLKLSNIPFEACPVALRNGEHMTSEFKEKFNRFQKVPFIKDNDFTLTESIAIIRYLSNKYNVPEKWYPKDAQRQARVDEYLEWQHHNTRAFCALYFRKKWLEPILTGTQPPPEVIERYENNMIQCLDNVEELWLSQGQDYIAGNEISVADIIAACELEQPRMCGFEPRIGRPKMDAWLTKVREECNPYYDEAHIILNKMVASYHKKMQNKL